MQNLKDVVKVIPLEELFCLLSFIEDQHEVAEEARNKKSRNIINIA